jgi:hypothetical protein
MEYVIDFTAGGVVKALHNDALYLGFLGDQIITRASDIRHDTATQLWGIHLAIGNENYMAPRPQAAGFATYESARDFEVLWLNECRKRQVRPESEEGHAVATELRGI